MATKFTLLAARRVGVIAALFVCGALLAEDVGTAPTGTSSRAAEALRTPRPEELAQRMAEAYAALDSLSFDMTVFQEGLREESIVIPRREVAWARVFMRGTNERAEIYRSHGAEHVFDYYEDGEMLSEVSAQERIQTPYPPGDLRICERVGFDGCLVGNLLGSWLAPNSTAHTVAWAARNMFEGEYLGMEDVEGHACYVVQFCYGVPGLDCVVADHTHYLDEKTYLIRKRVSWQRVFTADGDILQSVWRTKLFRNISTAHIPDEAFVPADSLSVWGANPEAGESSGEAASRP